MKVYLVRHAIAHERDRKRWPDDSRRPLTHDGRRRFRKAARGIASLVPPKTLILASPYVRTRQTAMILAAAVGGRLVASPELAHGGQPRSVFELLKLRSEDELVLVGHEPELGRLLAAMLGAVTARLEFKKGGAACVEFTDRVAPGAGILRWFLPPRVLRALRRARRP